MQIIEKSITEITPYEKNPRKNDEAVEYVANSIKEFGFKVPIVIDKDGVIVAGHTRYKAAQELGLEKLPCVIADDLTEEQVKAFRLADNKVGELAEWDDALLELELFDLKDVDLDIFGFDLNEDIENAKKEEKARSRFEKMQLRAFEHYDYVVFVFDNTMDWLNIVNEFGLKKVDAGYGKTKKLELEELLTEKDYLKKYDIRILILSKGRAESITTHKILPEWVEILVPESEKADYEDSVNNPILTIPDEQKGLGMVRNWVLKNFHEDIIIMIDDDIVRLYCLSGEFTENITDSEEAVQVLINTAVMAKDLGVHCFGYSQTDIRKYNGTEPFYFARWVGGVIGIIGRKYQFRNDKYKVDIDYCLQNLIADRILFHDSRYLWSQKRDNNKGGNSIFRTEEEFQRSVDTLQEKWGDNIRVKWHKGQVNISLNVKRRQSIEI